MIERPILFSGEMVRAILEGRKSQTRRVVKISTAADMYVEADRNAVGHWLLRSVVAYGQDYTLGACPYGEPGDRLWVRETFARMDGHEPGGREPSVVRYRADDAVLRSVPWSSAIHMPRWASRITLEVTGVRVERIADFHRRDGRAEGVECRHCRGYDGGNLGCTCEAEYRDLWDSLNAKRGYGWDANPWVWVVEFKRVDAEAQAAA